MSLFCRMLGHAALPAHHHNRGIQFGLCARCGDDLIRKPGEEDWEPVPAGARVVWRTERYAADSAAVAERMAIGPIPRRHHPRHLPRERMRNAPRPSEHRITGRTVLFSLSAKLLLAELVDRFFGPTDKIAPILYLPSPRAAPRYRGRSPRASWPEHSASLQRPSDRLEIW
jgi:hypothetical protein